MSSNLQFLTLQQYHLSKEKARKAVIRTLQQCDVREPTNGWDSQTLTWNDDDEKCEVTFRDLVYEARRSGIVEKMQRYLDKKDAVFGGLLQELATPNWQLTIKIEFAGIERKARGPCRSASSENDLTDDILYYREQTCKRSSEHDFRLTCRYFRAFLAACISIIDAFINRHILLADYEKFSTPALDILKATINQKERLRLWFSVCSTDDPTSFFGSREWCHFQEIRAIRNEVVHATNPIEVYSIEDIHRYLNKVRTGVGELLLRLRIAHRKPTLGFIERLRTAPLVDYSQITYLADGQHKVQLHPGS